MISSSGCQRWPPDKPAILAGDQECPVLLHHSAGRDREVPFYVLGRLAEPTQQDQFWCGSNASSGKTFTQELDSLVVHFATLADGSLLMAAGSTANSGLCTRCWESFSKPTLVRLKAAPRTLIALKPDLFLVPKSMFDAELKEDNNDNTLRYQAMIAAIEQEPVPDVKVAPK